MIESFQSAAFGTAIDATIYLSGEFLSSIFKLCFTVSCVLQVRSLPKMLALQLYSFHFKL